MPDEMEEDLFDQDPRESDDASDAKEDGDYGETFLAPKSAFAGKNLEVGAVHKVRVEATHDSEVELRCIKSKSDSDESEMAKESNPLYE